MKYFKLRTPDPFDMGIETSDPVGEKLQASKKMHKDGPVSRLFAPLNTRELKHTKENKNVFRKKL